jgi:hypothetical protein
MTIGEPHQPHATLCPALRGDDALGAFFVAVALVVVLVSPVFISVLSPWLFRANDFSGRLGARRVRDGIGVYEEVV